MKRYFYNSAPKFLSLNFSKWFLFFLLVFSNVSNGAIYYIDSVAGSDTNNGTSEATAWKNISKVNTLTLALNSRIYLKCGSVWNGQQLKFGGSGTSY